MRRFLTIAAWSIASTAAAVGALAYWASRHSYPPLPELHGTLERGALEHGGRTRTWIAYVPARPAPSSIPRSTSCARTRASDRCCRPRTPWSDHGISTPLKQNRDSVVGKK